MIDFLNFDSQLFDINVGKFELTNNFKIDSIKNQLNKFDLVYLFSNEDDVKINLKPVDTKIIFRLKLEDSSLPEPNSKVLITSTDFQNFEYSKLLKLSYLAGDFSRFKLDKNFRKGAFEAMYKLWLDESLNLRIANKVFICYLESNQTTPIGLITLKIDDIDNARIGLISVSAEYQGIGIGKKLIFHTINYLNEQNIKTLEVATQLENKNAVKFYLKCGFEEYSRSNVYHLWTKKLDLIDL
ncbi:MAG: GNAT family N-acetyltransferase [Bacteroidetes bacterium]|nr:GNAT family N-acetyltransferase [Bacteroidota bacterium]